MPINKRRMLAEGEDSLTRSREGIGNRRLAQIHADFGERAGGEICENAGAQTGLSMLH